MCHFSLRHKVTPAQAQMSFLFANIFLELADDRTPEGVVASLTSIYLALLADSRSCARIRDDHYRHLATAFVKQTRIY
jgi:hypothetical protein